MYCLEIVAEWEGGFGFASVFDLDFPRLGVMDDDFRGGTLHLPSTGVVAECSNDENFDLFFSAKTLLEVLVVASGGYLVQSTDGMLLELCGSQSPPPPPGLADVSTAAKGLVNCFSFSQLPSTVHQNHNGSAGPLRQNTHTCTHPRSAIRPCSV